MSYTRQQTQTIALVVLVGLMIAVGSYMAIIKPNLGRAGTHRASIKKWTTELGEQQRVVKKNLDSIQRAEQLEESTAGLEAHLRHGLFPGRLTSWFEDLRRTHGFEFRFQQDLEQSTPLYDGAYEELSNRFTILACDYHELARFIHLLETTNQGVRISDLKFEPHDAQKPDGLVDAQIEVRLVGFKDSRDDPWENADPEAFTSEGRNPFLASSEGAPDPRASVRERLATVRSNGTIGTAALIRPRADEAAVLVKIGGTLPSFEQEHVRLVRASDRALLVYHEPTHTHYKLTLHTSGPKAGEVETVEEITTNKE